MTPSLDPSSSAMLVVEMQNDLVHPRLVGERGLSGALARAVAERDVVPRLAHLLDVCRATGVPVLYAVKERHPSIPQPAHPAIYARAGSTPILVAGSEGAAVVDALKPHAEDVVVARYTSIDPSYGSELWSLLGRLGATTLIVAGVSTTLAVEGTVRAAANRGLRAVVAEDCCASVPQEWHEFSARNVLPLLAEVVSAAEIEQALTA